LELALGTLMGVEDKVFVLFLMVAAISIAGGMWYGDR
jgi:hypothetical protein